VPNRKSTFFDRPFLQGDAIPAAEATEVESEGAFEAWQALQDNDKAQFANTMPMADMPANNVDPRYASTEPGALLANPPSTSPPAGAREATLDEVMVEARRFNRVCPIPPKWQELYELLPGKKGSGRNAQPPAPLTGAVWNATPALAKRMVFRDHVEWAERHGFLARVHEFLKGLPEEQWHHMGD
jgi:hypothetical protein